MNSEPKTSRHDFNDNNVDIALLRLQLASARLRAENAEQRAAAAEIRAAEAEEEALAHKIRADKFESLVKIDPLTSLASRHAIDEEIAKENSRIQRGDSVGGALLFIDLDRFKLTNDTYGHDAGDQVLKTVGVLKKTIRITDTMARYGGDEFVILLSNVDPDEAMRKRHEITRTLNALHAKKIIHSTESSQSYTLIPIQGSCGIALLDGEKDLKTVKAESDAAMYEHKKLRRTKLVP